MTISPRQLYPAILLISAIGIAFQVGLMRVFSVAQWHHFAYMIISIAMLGVGASGTVIALLRNQLRGREAAAIRLCALAITLSLALCYRLSQAVPFETHRLIHEPAQLAYLGLLYVILAVPFFLCAACVTLAFFLAPRHIPRVYFFDMVGSGLGAFAVVALMYMVSPAAIPYCLTGFGAAAYLLLSCPWENRWTAAWRLVPLVAVLAIVFIPGIQPVNVSEYKDLSYALQYPDAEVVHETYSPLSVVTAVSSSMIRETPGQIANYPMSELGELPEQIGLFFDAGAVSPVHRFDGDLDRFAFLDYVTGALPYRLVDEPEALVLGAGGGTDILQALTLGARHVTAVEVDPGVFSLLEGPLRDFSGDLLARPDVEAVLAEGRGFAEANPDARYDLIQVPLFGSFGAGAGGVLALNESYVYTVEALAVYLDRLTDDGVLALTTWLKTPPRDAIKLFATTVEALEQSGVENPGEHMAFIRSWNNATIVASKQPLDDDQINAIREFSDERFLDLAYYPGITADEANRYTMLDEPHYYNAAQEILSPNREAFYEDYLFFIEPATDDRPYFFRFLKPTNLPHILREMGREWAPFMEWGYVVLLGAVAQGFIVSLALIVLPLAVFARKGAGRGARSWTLLYFTCLGLGYMFLEIGFIQTFMRFLAYPIYSVTVVLTSFMIFSGLGSLTAGRFMARKPVVVAVAALAILLLSVLYLAGLPPLFEFGAGWSDAVKITVSILLLAPLAFFMGMPFPAGLQLLSDRADGLVPWAWGINGFSSVIGASLATLTAVHFGFTTVVFIAVLIYMLSVWGILRLDGRLA